MFLHIHNHMNEKYIQKIVCLITKIRPNLYDNPIIVKRYF